MFNYSRIVYFNFIEIILDVFVEKFYFLFDLREEF